MRIRSPKLHPFHSFSLLIAVAGIGAILTSGAFAAEGAGKGPSEVVFLFQLMALIVVGRLLGELMQRYGQPGVTGQLLAGILLGPTVLGAAWPEGKDWLFPAMKEQKAMLDAVSQVGILMLLLLTGMETDLRLVRRAGLAAVSVSICGIVVPFACGFALGEMLPDAMLPNPDQRIITSLFLGTALSIASIKIVAMVVREMNFMRRNLGQIIVSSAIIDDSVGWIIIAIIFSLAEHGTVDLATLARGVLGTALFLGLSLTIGRRLVFFIIRWTNDNFVSDFAVISAILVIMGGMALITHFIGVHTVLGAFVAGVLIGESPILTKHIDEQLRGLITAFFAPVFFGVAGLGTDLTILTDPSLLLLTIGLILIASVGKFGGAFLGGKIGGLTRRESFALALGMNARGSTEVIIASIGLSLGALSQNLFSMIVAMAIVTTMVMPPTLRWALLRIPLGKDEEERLNREAFAERGFVTGMERLLVAVDEGANGKFASRLAGLLAGAFGMPTTVLHLDAQTEIASRATFEAEQKKAEAKKKAAQDENPEPDNGEDDDTSASAPEPAAGAKSDASKVKETGEESPAVAAVKAAAEKTRAIDADDGDKTPPKVDVTTKTQVAPAKQAIASEAAKGYDFLVIGIENGPAGRGDFNDLITQAAAGFEGPLAVVIARGRHRARPLQSRFRILVPVTGTGVSRRGAEVALALAHAANAQITALYVSASGNDGKRRRPLKQLIASTESEQAILKDIAEMADNFETPMTTASRADGAADEAILRVAKQGGYDLIVMGVSRRPGDSLFFGDVASSVLEQTDATMLFVASETYGQERRPTEHQETAR